MSGPQALAAAERLAGRLPSPRSAALRALRDVSGALLDRALVLVFPGPASATGEDLVELHCHGGRAVVAAVETALLAYDGVRGAEPGEFTRRALLNGRIDLTEAEGLADLLQAETEAQRRAALAAAEGQVSRAVRGWLNRILAISARVEASLDFAEEGDVAAETGLLDAACADMAALREEMAAVLAAPPVERLRDGIRVVIAGPPNSGKSTLLNMMAARDAAIVSPHSGTTRDRVEVPVQRDGTAYLLTDTAGLIDACDPVERMGIARAEEAIAAADIVLWLGDDDPPRSAQSLWVHSRCDLPDRSVVPPGRAVAIRSDSLATVEKLWLRLADVAQTMLPRADALVMTGRQRHGAREALGNLGLSDDPLILAENLRQSAQALATVLGINATEAMVDALFSRFCLGK